MSNILFMSILLSSNNGVKMYFISNELVALDINIHNPIVGGLDH
jgi:hypothetical protein